MIYAYKLIRSIRWFAIIGAVTAELPDELPHRWGEELISYHLVTKMSQWLMSDAFLKLRHATYIQEKYRNMLSYELGTIASQIQDKFKHMLETYRKYCNLTLYRENYYYVEDNMNAYHIIKGDFNEIQMERNLYYEAVARHEVVNSQKKKITNMLVASLLDKNKRQKKRSRRLGDAMNTTDLYHQNVSARNMKLLEEQYKKTLRHKKWAEKWNNFIPEVEGIDINEEARPKF